MTYSLKRGLPQPIPDRIKLLPIAENGFPRPWFVDHRNGVTDFRAIGPGKVEKAVAAKVCWICGRPLGKFLTFPIGPMCMVTGSIGEPPSHRTCAEWSVKACPFLSHPRARRNENDLPEERYTLDGAIPRNPGVVCTWTCLRYQIEPVRGGMLFKIGAPTDMDFWCEGRPAMIEEVMHSIETGLPILRAQCERDRDPAASRRDLDALVERTVVLINLTFAAREEGHGEIRAS